MHGHKMNTNEEVATSSVPIIYEELCTLYLRSVKVANILQLFMGIYEQKSGECVG